MRQQIVQPASRSVQNQSKKNRKEDVKELFATITAAVVLVIVIGLSLLMVEIFAAPKFQEPLTSEEASNGNSSNN